MSVCKAVEKKEAIPEPTQVVKNSQDVKSTTLKVSQVKELDPSASKSVNTEFFSAATRHCKKHNDYQTLARIRMARAAPRKRLKVAELAPASEL